VGGLVVSTAFTLFLVPCIYELVYARRRGRPAPAGAGSGLGA
jgi:Cu/Ag efflux pump CusA